MLDAYSAFLSTKILKAESNGFQPSNLSQVLFDFQRDIAEWACIRGQAAIFADCGLGKTLMQLEWGRQVHDRSTGPVLYVAPLSVAEQTVREGLKLGMAVEYVRKPALSPFQITNYEMIHAFVGDSRYGGIVLDESSILKSIDGKTRKILLDEFTDIPYRLCCTATPCPNDIAELANHAQFLGVMQRNEMLASFFVHDQDGWRLRGHAARPFYRWLASWAMSLKSPADIGYDGSRFVLPEITIHDEIVATEWRKPGSLFPGDLKGITDRASVRRGSIDDRVRRTAQIANRIDGQAVIWCGLNDESKMCAHEIIGSVEITGAMSMDAKKAALFGFIDGKYKSLVSKIDICGFGTNLQNASTMIFCGVGDSYEQYYQGIRRIWRFGQKLPVHVYVVVTDHETEIVANVRRKETEAETLSREIINAAAEYEMEQLKHMQTERETMTREVLTGKNWTVYQGDCVETMRDLPSDSIDLSVYSPPFLSLYQYSASESDMGNSKSQAQFFEHFSFMFRELLRMTKPGRNTCVHVAQTATTLATHGVIGLTDFRGKTIEAYQEAGWIYHGEVCIDKDPQAQAIRTHAKGLLFVQLRKDASWLRPGLADYILVFRKPGENAKPIQPDITNEDWIEWARPIWYGIRESETLNAAEARGAEDDRHICPLQLGTIERCIRLWSNAGEMVFSPFAGIGSEGFEAVRHGRSFIGCELKPLYARTAAKNLKRAESIVTAPTLF